MRSTRTKYPSTRVPDPSKLITVDQAMERYGVCRQTIYNHFHAGRITRYKIGRYTRIDTVEADAAIIVAVPMGGAA